MAHWRSTVIVSGIVLTVSRVASYINQAEAANTLVSRTSTVALTATALASAKFCTWLVSVGSVLQTAARSAVRLVLQIIMAW